MSEVISPRPKVISMIERRDNNRDMVTVTVGGQKVIQSSVTSVFVGLLAQIDQALYDLIYCNNPTSPILSVQELETLRPIYRSTVYDAGDGVMMPIGETDSEWFNIRRKTILEKIPYELNGSLIDMMARLENIFREYIADDRGNVSMLSLKQLRLNRTNYPITLRSEHDHWVICGKYLQIDIPYPKVENSDLTEIQAPHPA